MEESSAVRLLLSPDDHVRRRAAFAKETQPPTPTSTMRMSGHICRLAARTTRHPQGHIIAPHPCSVGKA